MNSRLLRRNGTILVAVTILAFVALPFWMARVFYWVHDWAEQGGVLPIWHFLIVLLFLPLLIMAIGWMGFLIAWFVSIRAKSAPSPQNGDRLAKARARFLVLAAAVVLVVTTLVELFYLDWMGGAFGSSLDQSDYALLHLYLYIEAPQFFLALLWTALLAIAWLPPPNSPASNWRLYPPIGLLVLAATGLVWAGYPYWMSGIATVAASNMQIPAAAIHTFEALPTLFVMCLFICFFWFVATSLRSRRALVQPGHGRARRSEQSPHV
jgi:Na+-transporting methylmalonyl-CoA/oxaloacetate decarboxylase gamma subunit